VLVNNVGGLVARKKLAEMDEDFFNLVMFLNMNSTFLTTQAVVPHMPQGGAIVNLASLAGRDGGGGGAAAYSALKRRGDNLHPQHGQGAWPARHSRKCVVPRHD